MGKWAGAAAFTGWWSGHQAPQKGVKVQKRIRQSVCRWPYGDVSLDRLCIEAAALGMEGVELVGPDEWHVLKKHGLTCPMANGAEPGIDVGFIDRSLHADLQASYRNIIPKVGEAGFPQLICFAGNANGIDPIAGMKAFEEGIKPLLSLAERHNVVLCLELFNTKVDHPGYMADSTAWGAELCRRIGSDHFKLLYDIYHMQIMEGDIIRTIRAHTDCISHFHTGGVPGRHEINETQEINYAAVMQAIADTGYNGFVGQEFIPSREDPFESLREAVRICDV